MIYYIWSLIFSFSGVITDLEVRKGEVYVAFQSGTVISHPSLDTIWHCPDMVWNDQEMGLLGITSNDKDTYLNYSGYDSAQHIIRLSDGKELLKISHVQHIGTHNTAFAKTHKGGALDIYQHYLYIAVGDGGFQGDPFKNAQNPHSWLGKILRYDLNTDSVVVWAKGLRNPWKIAIVEKGVTASMYVTDVGWHEREEVSRVNIEVDSVNFGWRCYEGSYPQNSIECFGLELVFPIHEYVDFANGSAIIGAWVDKNRFIYADHYKDRLFLVNANGSLLQQRGVKYVTVIKDGYVGTWGGKLYRLTPKPNFAPLIQHTVLLDGREVNEEDIPPGVMYVKDGKIIMKQE